MKKISWAKRLALGAMGAVVGAASFMVPAEAASATTTAPVTLRSGTSTRTAALTTIPSGVGINIVCQAKGQTISGTYNSDWWAKVTYNGRTGYATRAYIRVPSGTSVPTCGTTRPAPSGNGTVVGAGVNVRSQANTRSSILTSIPSGARVAIQCQTRGATVAGVYNTDWWAKLSYNGKTGYASRAYIRVAAGTNVPTCAGSPAPAPGGVNAWTPHAVGAPISRELVLARAKYWTDRRLPYNWNISHKDPQGKYYRADCSGMVSMALHLTWSPSTRDLRNYVYPISKSQLRPGDIIGNLGPGSEGANGHVVVFNGWVPGTNQTRFYSLEEQGGVGAIAQTRPWGTSYWNVQGWRYNKISN
ncbi:MAG: SH3 domain-containing protein [Propionibacteriaceae bacterium]|nr:SH3 domain-containing protein [Propionibacteriaceae bacterium]